jgi:ubiquinone/menaquinone biosynthesis C-methylase UbiE
MPYAESRALEFPGRSLVASPERLLEQFEIQAGDTVLDLGTGIGFYAVHASRLVGGRGRLLCLDLQLDMIREARSSMRAAQATAQFVVGAADAIPLRTASIDHVILVAVLGEVFERAAALREVRRLLRPTGRLSLWECFLDPDFIPLQTLRRDLEVAGFAEVRTSGRLTYSSTWRVRNDA